MPRLLSSPADTSPAAAAAAAAATVNNGTASSTTTTNSNKRLRPATSPTNSSSQKISVRRFRCLLKYAILPLLCLSLLSLQLQGHFFLQPAHHYNQQHHYYVRRYVDSSTTRAITKEALDKANNNQGLILDENENSKRQRGMELWSQANDRLKQDFMFGYNNNITRSTTRRQVNTERQQQQVQLHRKRPNDKIVYLLHIHKSAGTLMCHVARANNLQVSKRNCNVQRDQRCCGNQDTLHAQQQFANSTAYDLVASEQQMYAAMDPEQYRYIVVLRKSQQRYFSHWKHVLRAFEQMPFAYRQHDEPVLVAAGGGNKQQQQQQQQHHENLSNRQDLFSLLRETKAQRQAQRNERLQQMADLQLEQQQQAKQQHDPAKKNQPPVKALEDLTLEDFTDNANQHNKDIFMPQRRRRRRLLLVQREYPLKQHHPLDGDGDIRIAEKAAEDEAEEEGDDEDADMTDSNNDVEAVEAASLKEYNDQQTQKDGQHGTPRPKKKQRHSAIMPHPCESPNAPHQPPLVGLTFEEWWKGQPDNWNFRQLCGTRCMGIPKYQLSVDDWDYTLQRFLQFDTVLFMEDLQTSVHQFVKHVGWNVTSDLTEVEEIAKKNEPRKRTKEPTGLSRLRDWVAEQLAPQVGNKNRNMKQKKRQHREVDPKEMNQWDPLMAALDEALYDIGQRWEAYKMQTGKTSDQLSSDELEALSAIESLPDLLQLGFEHYMDDQPGNHRHVCQTECCAEQCTAY